MIPNTRPEIGKKEIKAQAKVLKSGWLARGPETEAFEKEFSEYTGIKYCLFTNCCTNALKMAYKWALSQGYDGFDYPENTYCATYAAFWEVQGPWIKVRSNPFKVNVHFGSVKDETPCLIEDSAHRIEPNDPLVGKIRCYSFHANKNMTTGQGGMFCTNDKKIYEWALLQINDGLKRTKLGRFDYTVETMAGGYEGGDLNACIGRVQLKKLPMFNERRNRLVTRYNEAFGTDWTGNHIFPLYLENYDEVKKMIIALEKEGVSCKSHYPGSNVMTLPLYPSLSLKKQKEVIGKVNAYFNRKK